MLYAEVLECRTRSNLVIQKLKELRDLSKIPNHVIAEINDIAYKAIQQGSLNKLLGKRSLANEELYQRLDQEAAEILNKIDFEKVSEENKTIVEEIGCCAFSTMDTIEALQEADCMCIGLRVHRPEAAIADASRLIIKEIVPTIITAESFLQSAKFNIEQYGEAIGNFDPKNDNGNLAMGLGREKITGVLPLFLFKEHWWIAKRKIQAAFGLMCTLDPMGYSTEQLFTIPFLVL